MTYHLLLKTGQAELRAWKNLSDARKSEVSVHVELTRGRKRRNKDKSAPAEYDIEKILKCIVDDFQSCAECTVDITRETSLASADTEALSSPVNGYQHWVDKLKELKGENPNIKPTLLINPTGQETYEEYESAIFAQFDELTDHFDLITYRAAVIHDASFLEDIEMLADKIKEYIESGNRFRVLLDFEYVQPSTSTLHASYAVPIVRSLNEMIPGVEIVSVGTSFPKIITEIGDEDSDTFALEEVRLNAELNRLQNIPIGYGDYGSINPIRSDVSPPVGPYLRPHVDFTTSDGRVLYYRIKPDVDPETKTLRSPRIRLYKQAASLIVNDSRFSPIPDSWGYDKIIEASRGLPEGSSPDFWISVRMEIHICQQLDRLRQEANDAPSKL